MNNSIIIINKLRIARESMARVVDAHACLNVVFECNTVEEALPSITKYQPNLVIIEISNNTPSTIKQISVANSQTKAVIYGSLADEKLVFDCACAGASGYIDSEASEEDLILTVFSALRNEIYNPRIGSILNHYLATKIQTLTTPSASSSDWHVSTPVAKSAARVGLTPRERQIVSLIDKGMSNKQIANRLNVESSTVKNHVHNILGKYRVRRRGEAAAMYRESQKHSMSKTR